jgi:hypothetical protein
MSIEHHRKTARFYSTVELDHTLEQEKAGCPRPSAKMPTPLNRT